MTIPQEIKDQCLKLSMKGKNSKEIYNSYYSKHYNTSLDSFKRNLRNWKKRNTISEIDLIDILKKGIVVSDFINQQEMTLEVFENRIDDLKTEGYNLLRIGDEIKISNIVIPGDNHIKNSWDGTNIIRFGMVSDTHLNSKDAQITHLHTFYDICQSEGINNVYHVGDMDEGEQMRTGHQYECYNQGADDHVSHIVKVYPKRDNIVTQFITGNHDASIIKRCGYDIGYPIANRRSDMIYLGQSNAIIKLTPNCTMEIRHPLDGSASYALSYKLQKMIDAISGGEKPNILAVGHYHKAEYLMYRNIHAFQAATFQGQTNWMRGKGLSASLGGWIIEVHVDDEGSIKRIKPEFIPFYKTIHNDYENWL